MKSRLQKNIVPVGLIGLLMPSAGFSQTRWARVVDPISAGWNPSETATYCFKLGNLLDSGCETTNCGHSARTTRRDPVEGSPC